MSGDSGNSEDSITFGSVIVKEDCTFYIYSDRNFTGNHRSEFSNLLKSL